MRLVAALVSLLCSTQVLNRWNYFLSVCLESFFLTVMLQVHRKLIDSEFFQLGQATNVFIGIAKNAEAILEHIARSRDRR